MTDKERRKQYRAADPEMYRGLEDERTYTQAEFRHKHPTLPEMLPTCTCDGRKLDPTGWSFECPIDSHREMAAKVRSTEMPKRETQPATPKPQWWCCSADYPNHEATCRNFKLEAQPRMPSASEFAEYLAGLFAHGVRAKDAAKFIADRDAKRDAEIEEMWVNRTNEASRVATDIEREHWEKKIAEIRVEALREAANTLLCVCGTAVIGICSRCRILALIPATGNAKPAGQKGEM
jgi:hypothetical protein